MIEVTNLTKRYGDHVAVDHISFTIEKGKIYGFLGPNGAGKSTTMNMITGYLAATEGEVRINGHDIFEEPEEAKRCIGYLPELPPLYMDMTPKEYLEFVVELKGIPKKDREQMIIDVVELTKIKDVAHRLIKNLSKGYRQRVGLAQAVLGYPEVIILDEPTVGLDPKQIIEIRDLIKKLGKKHTVILSSHILSEVSAVCDEVIIIGQGKVLAVDTPDNLGKFVTGANNIELLVKGPDYKIKSVIKKIRGVRKSEVHNAPEPECCSVVLTCSAEDDIRENVFFAFSEAKLPILSMGSVNVSLEDVFLKVTEGSVGDRRPGEGRPEEHRAISRQDILNAKKEEK